MVRTRSRYGVADHVGNAAFAALIACLACDRVPFWKRPSTRLVSAGLASGEGAGGPTSLPSPIIGWLFPQTAPTLSTPAPQITRDSSVLPRSTAFCHRPSL